jgi:hypothetical protein
MSNNPDNFDQVLPPADGASGTDANAAITQVQLSKAEAAAAEFRSWLRSKAENDNVLK